jgi:hypothetical protein
MTPLRQLTYQLGSPLLGPDGDPAGWKALEPVKVTGKLFGMRPVSASLEVGHDPSVIYLATYPLLSDVCCSPSEPHSLMFRL